MNKIAKYMSIWLVLLVWSCSKPENFELGPVPTAEDANFTFTASSQGANYLTFTNNNPKSFMRVWDFGNGSGSKDSNPVAYFPFAGDYTVKLTVFTSGGSVSSSKVVKIAANDPQICNNARLKLLTGGCDVANGKTWVIDKDRAGHFGVGPAAETSPIWYAAQANEKVGGGMYDDEFTFFLNASRFVQKTNGDVFVNPAHGSKFAGAAPSPVGDLIAPFQPQPANYTLTTDASGKVFLNISNGGFIGYYTGVSTYEVLSLNENEMFIKFRDAANPDLAWFHRLIRKGFTPAPPPPPQSATLPITFEGATAIPFNSFGGSDFEQINNPDRTGINTSEKVGKTAKGGEVWAGNVVTLNQNIDFTKGSAFRMKVWSPVRGTARFKLEKAGDAATFKEVDAQITKTNTWEELVFDFSGSPSNTYSLVAVFFDFGNAGNGRVFYFDDIVQAPSPVNTPNLPFTFETQEPKFDAFGNVSFAVLANPQSNGINTSGKVARITKVAASEVWGGVVVALPQNLDFSTRKQIKVKVWSPIAGAVVRLKIENATDAAVFIEKDQTITQANTWQELTWDFSEAKPNTYSKIAFFMDFGQQRAGEFLFDDMRQE
jgi:PKD repeat protein